MYKKIISVILVSALAFGTGCGAAKNEADSTKTPEVKSTEKETKNTQEMQETEQDIQETETMEETSITVTFIQVNTDTKSICVEAKFITAENITETDYSVAGVQVLRAEAEPVENGYNVRWYGFYQEETAYQNVKIEKPFAQEQAEAVENTAEVEEVEAKKFDVTVGERTVPVWITPFALLISPEEDWRDDGEFYNVIAIDTDKTQHYICSLPMMDDRKPSLQKDDPLENLDIENLDELGGGLAFSVELEHCGIQSVFCEKVDLNQIEKIAIICYHKAGE